MPVEEDRGRIRRSVRDGVPVYWTPEAPRLTGALMFRSGRGDETVITGGISHIVEHLALHGFATARHHDFNGFVDGNRTVFHATGTPDEVGSFMRDLCQAISSLPLDRLEAECRVLRTEALGRTVAPPDLLQWFRFGPRGHGLVWLREYAFEAPDPETVRSWAARHFTLQNATAWFSGPIPDSVRFEGLPDGARTPILEAKPIRGLRTPAWLTDQPGGISVSFVSARDRWLSLALGFAARRLHERLRHREGLTYAFTFEYHPIAAQQAHSTIWTSCLPDHAPAIQRGLMETLEELGRQGPTDEEVRQARQDFARSLTDPDWAGGYLDSAAFNELVGYQVRSPEDHEREFQEMSAERCAEAIRLALETALLMLPPGCSHIDDWSKYPAWSADVVRGRRFRSTTQRYPWSKKLPELIVGEEGVSFVTPQGAAITVRYEACAGAVVHPDGGIHMVSDDGFTLWIRSAEWHNGKRAGDEVRRALPQDRTLIIPAR